MFPRCSLQIKSLNCLAQPTKMQLSGRCNGGIRITFQKKSMLNLISSKDLFRFRQKTTSTGEQSIWSVIRTKMFTKYLLLTNTMCSGLLMALGDLAAQTLDNVTDKSETPIAVNYRRVCNMFITGATIGPVHHFVYHWLDKIMPTPTLRNVIRKIIFDQAVMSPTCIIMFFYVSSFLDHISFRETSEELASKFLYIYAIDMLLWPPAQFLNFRYLQTKHRVIYINAVTAFYNTFLSYAKHSFDWDF